MYQVFVKKLAQVENTQIIMYFNVYFVIQRVKHALEDQIYNVLHVNGILLILTILPICLN
jgi:hypothetical protein